MVEVSTAIDTLSYTMPILGLLLLGVTRAVRREIIARQRGTCFDCYVEAGNQLEIHHIIPQSAGGGTVIIFLTL